MKNQIVIKPYQRDFLERVYNNKQVLNHILMQFLQSNYKNQRERINDYASGWTVVDTDDFKYFYNYSHSYHTYFSKIDGFTCRISDRIDNADPAFSILGPEILDLEISVNGCPKVGGKNCKFCYKNNSDKPPTNMSFDTFVKIVSKFPKCLYSIAFGITGVQTNPDFPKMLQWCRENDIVPNYTLSGADLNNELLEVTTKYCGAVAVSCYEGNKQLCYDTIKRVHEYSKGKVHVNMHIVLSEDETQIKHIWDVLDDIKNGKVIGLRNIVFLRIKPVGRAGNMNCQIHLDTYKKIMTYCMENDIGFGFDSCSAKTAIRVLNDMGRGDLTSSCEPCESSKFSSYINVLGEYWNCSFCERSDFFKPINVLNIKNFDELWNNEQLVNIRDMKYDRSCPVYDLDSKE